MLTPEFVEEQLKLLRRDDPQLLNAGVSGHCDAFAVSLKTFFNILSIPSQIFLISRQRLNIEDHDEVIDSNPLSHVVLEALGTTWDVWGSDALQRWGKEWRQPEADDETVPCEDLFECRPIGVKELQKLRYSLDERHIDEKAISRYTNWIHSHLNSLKNDTQKIKM